MKVLDSFRVDHADDDEVFTATAKLGKVVADDMMTIDAMLISRLCERFACYTLSFGVFITRAKTELNRSARGVYLRVEY